MTRRKKLDDLPWPYIVFGVVYALSTAVILLRLFVWKDI